MSRYLGLAPAWLLQSAGVALAYVLVAVLALELTIPPNYASPLYPSAGIALAAMLCFGYRMAPSVALASFLANVLLSADRGQLNLLGPALIGIGAALQAIAGAALVRRWVGTPVSLEGPRELMRFNLLGALLACTISPTVGVLSLRLTGMMEPDQTVLNWLTWWMGDALGVLIGAPVALTLIGQPRSAWAPRRLSVGLTMVVATLFMSLGISQVGRWDEQRARSVFERDALGVTNALISALQEPLRALEATRGVMVVAPQLPASDFRRASEVWLLPGDGLLALGWAARVALPVVADFEAAVRTADGTDYQIRDRADGDAEALAQDSHKLAIRHISPAARNSGARGINVLSVPAAREAALRSQRIDAPAASAGFRLSQDQQSGNDSGVGVVIYHAVYAGPAQTVTERMEAMRGAVFATVRADTLLKSIASNVPDYLQVCLVDTDPLARYRRLAGPEGCEQLHQTSFMKVYAMPFAGRQWDIRTYVAGGHLPAPVVLGTWLFAGVGLLAISLLGALLLTVTGRAHRIEVAVRERTAELQQEMQERERTASALRASEQRFRNIFENVPIGIIFTDLRGYTKESNPRIRRMIGYEEAEMSSMVALEFTHPDDRDEDIRLSRQLVLGEIPMYRRRKRYLAKDGSEVTVQVLVSLLHDETGKPYRIVGVVEDISEHLKLHELERAREAAEAANQAKSDFLSRMSHELRTPLNAMLGFTQLLEMDREHPLSQRQQGWMMQVQQAGWHLLEMINDTLDLSRIESGAIKLTVESLSLPDLLTWALAMVHNDAEQRGLSVTQALHPDAALVLADATRLKQVLTNLLSNAVKYNIEHGRIHIATRVLGSDYLELAVTDTGLGMSEQQLAAMFEPFNRLGREHSATEGTGIGLVICKRLVELMGGTLKVRSTKDEGSSFIVTLPRAVEPSGVRPVRDTAPGLPPEYRKRMVHYIEDNETNAEVMRGILAQRPQVELLVSMTGQAGIAAARAHPPHVILLDMHLPDMNGMDVLNQLRKHHETADTPVVVVSADALPLHMEAAYQQGVYRYLTKPVNVPELLCVLDELLDVMETRFG